MYKFSKEGLQEAKDYDKYRVAKMGLCVIALISIAGVAGLSASIVSMAYNPPVMSEIAFKVISVAL